MTVSWQHNVTLYQLRVFLTVTRHKNYTHAAEELYLSQPSVSAQVHELERLIGTPLFEQVGKRLVLTQAGQVLADHALNVLNAVEQAADSLERLKRVESGHLQVLASTTVGNYLLPKVLGAFHARYPLVELVLSLKNSEEVCEEIRLGHAEIGLIESTVENVGEELILKTYQQDELVLIVPAWHPWAGAGNISVRALAQAVLLWRERGSGTRRIIEVALREAGIQPHVTMQFGSTEAIKQAVAANVGIALVSHIAVGAEVAAGWLSIVRFEDLTLRRTFSLVQRRNGHLSSLAEAFLQQLSLQVQKEES